MVAAGCSLLNEANWTSQGVGQSHGSLAWTHRQHKDLNAQSVAMRASLHQRRHLWAVGEHDLESARVSHAISRLEAREIHAAHGRSVFYKEFVDGGADGWPRRDDPASGHGHARRAGHAVDVGTDTTIRSDSRR